jgi:hypothetical protein
VFRIVGGRKPSQERVAIGADKDGKITSFIREGVTAQSTDNDPRAGQLSTATSLPDGDVPHRPESAN